MGVGFFKHFQPKKAKENDNVPAKNQSLLRRCQGHDKAPEKKHFKPKKSKENVHGEHGNINIPAEKQSRTLAQVCAGHEGPEKYTILSYGQKPSLEQVQAANKKWFNDNEDKCEVSSENFDVTTTTRHGKIRFSEPLVTLVIAADIYDRTTSTVSSQIQFLGEMAETFEKCEK